MLERSRLSNWIKLGKLLGTDQLRLVSNDLKIGPNRLVQSIELSIGPWFGSVQLLSRKGLRIGIEPVVELPNQTEPERFSSTKNLGFFGQNRLWLPMGHTPIHDLNQHGCFNYIHDPLPIISNINHNKKWAF